MLECVTEFRNPCFSQAWRERVRHFQRNSDKTVAIRIIVWNHTLILVWLGTASGGVRDHVSEATHGPMPHVIASGRPSPPVRRKGAV